MSFTKTRKYNRALQIVPDLQELLQDGVNLTQSSYSVLGIFLLACSQDGKLNFFRGRLLNAGISLGDMRHPVDFPFLLLKRTQETHTL